jgi:sec-independent protein translocase protein TatA
MGLGELSPLHLIIVLVVALIVIGPGKLPDVGAALGKSIREFRLAARDVPGVGPDGGAPAAAPAAAPVAAPVADPAPVTTETV